MKSLVFGDELVGDGSNITAIQTPGGCGALESLQRYWPLQRLMRLFGSATLLACSHPANGVCWTEVSNVQLLRPASHGVDFDNMASDLKAAKKGDVVLLHGCCHNPSGADLTLAQWGQIADMAEAQGHGSC